MKVLIVLASIFLSCLAQFPNGRILEPPVPSLCELLIQLMEYSSEKIFGNFICVWFEQKSDYVMFHFKFQFKKAQVAQFTKDHRMAKVTGECFKIYRCCLTYFGKIQIVDSIKVLMA